MKLDFKNGKFILSDLTSSDCVTLSQDPRWSSTQSLSSFETGGLRAAVVYKQFASLSAKEVFKRALQEHYKLPWLPPLHELDAHQRAGLEWILTRKRSYLAHAPGAGKTAQAILGALLSRGLNRSLFIVPPSLIQNWVREIYKVSEWLNVMPSVGVVPLTAEKERTAWNADLMVCPDSMLAKPWVYEELLRFPKKFIAVDEASRFKDSKAERSVAFYGGVVKGKHYPGLFADAHHVVFLDGSPMPNRPMELWAPTYALHPEAIDCMGQHEFGLRYCGATVNYRGAWEYNHASNEAELKTRLQADFMHVVTEAELSHPERLRSMVYLNEDFRSPEHKSWERKNLSTIAAGEESSQGEIARFRKELGIRKIPAVVQYVRDKLTDKNESIIVFAWHRDVCLELAGRLHTHRPMVVMGGTPPHEREESFQLFQSKERKLLIMNIAAGGRGHNLQAAQRIIFAEYSWTDELNKQAEKRASRRGNDALSIRCEYMVSPNSMDEIVLSSLFTKQKRVEKIIG